MSRAKLATGWAGPVDLHEAAAVVIGRRSKAATIANRARNTKLDADQRRAAAAAGIAAALAARRAMAPEDRRASYQAGARKRWRRMTPEQRAAFSRLGVEAARKVPADVRRESARRAAMARWAKVRAARGAA